MPSTSDTEIKLLWQEVKRAAAQAKRNLAAGHFFTFYTNLLSKDAQYQWDKIVALQVNTAPWTNIQGKEQPKACVKLYLSFMDCVTLHLRRVYAEDAAEQELYYISNVLKKPQRILVRYFFQ